jgi:transcriptional regulator with XRE-family HTH domain
VFEFHAFEKEPKSTSRKASRLYRNPVYLAQEWQKTFANGDSTPTDLARKLGVSRARVTQVLRIFNLAPEVLKAIAALGDPLPSPIVTERRLRPIVNLPAEEQRRRVETILAGRESVPPKIRYIKRDLTR